MAVIISEIEAEVSGEAAPESGGAGEPRPAEALPQQALLDLLELSQERKDRLASD